MSNKGVYSMSDRERERESNVHFKEHVIHETSTRRKVEPRARSKATHKSPKPCLPSKTQVRLLKVQIAFSTLGEIKFLYHRAEGSMRQS